MKILITGATGFIGSHIAGALGLKHKVIAPTRDPGNVPDSLRNKGNITFVKFEAERLEEMVQSVRPDVVVNLLGIIRENRSTGSTFRKVHYDYVIDLVEGAKKAGAKKFIQMSALGSAIDSKSQYLSTKARAEDYLRNSGFPHTIFRPSIILGEGQKMFDDFRDYASFSPFFPAPAHKLQPVHIHDVRDCFLKAVNENLTGQAFDLCGTRVINYRELFGFILRHIKVKRPVFTAPDLFFTLSLPVMGILPNPPLTLDQYYMFQQDNVCQNSNDAEQLLGKLRDAFAF
ncbi:MAG: NAD(P)H-binding protein [Bacteroidia bacterium]